MIDSWLDSLGAIIAGNFWLGLIIAFVAGLLTFFTPCALSSVPMVIAYVGGTSSTRKKAFVYSLFVALGESLIFIVLGVVGALIGQMLSIGGIWMTIFYIILGILMVIMAYEMWGLTNIFGKTCGANIKTSKKGVLGAFLIGLTGGLFATPCATPVISAMVAYTSISAAGWWQSVLLMLMYSIGFNVFMVVAGTSIGFARQMQSSPKFEKAAKIIKIALGVIIFIFGLYLIISALYL
jgi:cytochrome c biogenesis protein CcdA